MEDKQGYTQAKVWDSKPPTKKELKGRFEFRIEPSVRKRVQEHVEQHMPDGSEAEFDRMAVSEFLRQMDENWKLALMGEFDFNGWLADKRLAAF